MLLRACIRLASRTYCLTQQLFGANRPDLAQRIRGFPSDRDLPVPNPMTESAALNLPMQIHSEIAHLLRLREFVEGEGEPTVDQVRNQYVVCLDLKVVRLRRSMVRILSRGRSDAGGATLS